MVMQAAVDLATEAVKDAAERLGPLAPQQPDPVEPATRLSEPQNSQHGMLSCNKNLLHA